MLHIEIDAGSGFCFGVTTAIKNINMVTMEVQAGSEEMLKGGESVTREMSKLDNLTHIITDSRGRTSLPKDVEI